MVNVTSDFTMAGRMAKYLRSCERENEALTRDGGWINTQLALKATGSVAYSGETEFTQWVLRTLWANGLQAQLDKQSFSGDILNFISSEKDRIKQLQEVFGTNLPPFAMPFSNLVTNTDVREAWSCLWNAISGRQNRYGGPMPEGWGEEYSELWLVFTGASNGTKVIAKMRELNIPGNFTNFVKDRMKGIYMVALETEERIEEYWMENSSIPYRKLQEQHNEEVQFGPGQEGQGWRGQEGPGGRGQEQGGRGQEGQEGRGQEAQRGRCQEGQGGRGQEGQEGRGQEGQEGRGQEGQRGRSQEGQGERGLPLGEQEGRDQQHRLWEQHVQGQGMDVQGRLEEGEEEEEEEEEYRDADALLSSSGRKELEEEGFDDPGESVQDDIWLLQAEANRAADTARAKASEVEEARRSRKRTIMDRMYSSQEALPSCSTSSNHGPRRLAFSQESNTRPMLNRTLHPSRPLATSPRILIRGPRPPTTTRPPATTRSPTTNRPPTTFSPRQSPSNPVYRSPTGQPTNQPAPSQAISTRRQGYKCPLDCGRTYPSKARLDRHIIVSKQYGECPMTG